MESTKKNIFIPTPGVLCILRQGVKREVPDPISLPTERVSHPGPVLVATGALVDGDIPFLKANTQFTEIRTSYLSRKVAELLLARPGTSIFCWMVLPMFETGEAIVDFLLGARARFDMCVFFDRTMASEIRSHLEDSGLPFAPYGLDYIGVSNWGDKNDRHEFRKAIFSTPTLRVIDATPDWGCWTEEIYRDKTEICVIHANSGCFKKYQVEASNYYAILEGGEPGFAQHGVVHFLDYLPRFRVKLEERREANRETATLALLTAAVPRLRVATQVRRLGPLLREVAGFL